MCETGFWILSLNQPLLTIKMFLIKFLFLINLRSIVGFREWPTALELKKGPDIIFMSAVENLGQWTKVWPSNNTVLFEISGDFKFF